VRPPSLTNPLQHRWPRAFHLFAQWLQSLSASARQNTRQRTLDLKNFPEPQVDLSCLANFPGVVEAVMTTPALMTMADVFALQEVQATKVASCPTMPAKESIIAFKAKEFLWLEFLDTLRWSVSL